MRRRHRGGRFPRSPPLTAAGAGSSACHHRKDSASNRWRHRWCKCIIFTKRGSAHLRGGKKQKQQENQMFFIILSFTRFLLVFRSFLLLAFERHLLPFPLEVCLPSDASAPGSTLPKFRGIQRLPLVTKPTIHSTGCLDTVGCQTQECRTKMVPKRVELNKEESPGVVWRS